ncbi:MAG: CpaF family protein [Bryobacteraceae bacterium]
MESTNFQQLKIDVHRTLLGKMDLEKLASAQNGRARQAVSSLIGDILVEQSMPLSALEKDQMQSELLDEIFGLGPLEPLLKDPDIADILVNNKDTVYIERFGKVERTPIKFRDDAHLMRIIDRIVSRVGRRIDESSPMVDARLSDGSRVNAIIPPLALDGPSMSIRRFGSRPFTADRLIETRSMSEGMLELLAAAVRARISILISGGTGAGKTTFLNMLSSYIPRHERLITIEDAAELRLQHENVVRLETRPSNVEGKGAVRQRELLVNSLRMRPDRIIVGEVRGEEAFDMLQAMNTGHEGSMTTIHANTPRDAIARLESMVAMANFTLPDRAVRQQIASAIGIIVQVSRMSDGTRKVTHISEISGMEQDVISMQDIFKFDRKGIGPEGAVLGAFRPSGVRPKFLERVRLSGIMLSPALFETSMEVQ